MLSRLNILAANKLPWLGKPKRFVLAYWAKHTKTKPSYAQIGDDLIAMDLLRSEVKGRAVFYIDVGANHPSRLSNTYRMYREGVSGVTIDPNEELMSLHRLIRPRDIQLSVGCGNAVELSKFYYSTTPVLSSFSASQVDNVWGMGYLPVFTLDRICEDLKIDRVDFLSIDVEGLDLKVLEGATATLSKTYLVCVEANSSEEEHKIIEFMARQQFELKVKNRWNLFFMKR